MVWWSPRYTSKCQANPQTPGLKKSQSTAVSLQGSGCIRPMSRKAPTHKIHQIRIPNMRLISTQIKQCSQLRILPHRRVLATTKSGNTFSVSVGHFLLAYHGSNWAFCHTPHYIQDGLSPHNREFFPQTCEQNTFASDSFGGKLKDHGFRAISSCDFQT